MVRRVRLIKRYANRKLYDTTASRYVTLDEIGVMIKAGEEIQIFDNKSKEDITAVTMAQILVEEEKRERSGDGTGSRLRELIQTNTAMLSKAISDPVHNIQESVTKLLRSGEERAAETRDQLQSWLEHNTDLFDLVQRRVDERLKQVVGGLDAVGRMQREIVQLRERVEVLEKEREGRSASGARSPDRG